MRGASHRSTNSLLRQDSLSVRGHVFVRGFDAKYIVNYADTFSPRKVRQGLIYEDPGTKNLIVNAGSNLICQLCTGVSLAFLTYCAVSGDTTAVSPTDTVLAGEIQRLAVTAAYAVSNVAHWDTFWSTSQGNGTWNKTALFNASSGGTMGSEKLLSSSFTKSTSNTAVISWQWTFTPQ